jgi:hypothetical protein
MRQETRVEMEGSTGSRVSFQENPQDWEMQEAWRRGVGGSGPGGHRGSGWECWR